MVDDHSLTTSRLGESIKLSRVSLRDEAVQALRTMIVDGTLAAGTRINEAELAATLGISRGPLREAIQRVGAEGLIQFRRNRGAFVRELALGDIRDMYEARLVIEGMAARWAARHATESQIVALRQQARPRRRATAQRSNGVVPTRLRLPSEDLGTGVQPRLGGGRQGPARPTAACAPAIRQLTRPSHGGPRRAPRHRVRHRCPRRGCGRRGDHTASAALVQTPAGRRPARLPRGCHRSRSVIA